MKILTYSHDDIVRLIEGRRRTAEVTLLQGDGIGVTLAGSYTNVAKQLYASCFPVYFFALQSPSLRCYRTIAIIPRFKADRIEKTAIERKLMSLLGNFFEVCRLFS